MDKRVLRERIRKKQQQLRRRRMMKIGGYILAVVLVIVFVVRGVIFPIANRIGGNTDKPVQTQAKAGAGDGSQDTAGGTDKNGTTEEVETDADAAYRMPLKGKADVAKASDLTAGWHEDKNGRWYQNFDGTYYAGGRQEIDGQTYSFDDNGYIQTGWVSDGFNDLYFNEDGTYNPEEHKTRIALTFDDGPGEYTDQLLDCLEENNAHATFFMLGQNVGSWESTVQRMADIGCEIGNHSYDHQDMMTLSDEQIAEEFTKTDDALVKACGQKATVGRVPYGSGDQHVFDIAQKPFFMWSLDTLDWQTLNADADYKAVMEGDLTDGSIILMHDIHEPSVQAALKIIPDLVAKGYKLMTVSELAEAKGVTLQNASYSEFWDSSLSKGQVPGYDGPLLQSDDSGDGSDNSDDGSGDGSDLSDGSDGSGDDGSYDDGSTDDGSYDDSSYDDGSGDDGSYDDGSGDY